MPPLIGPVLVGAMSLSHSWALSSGSTSWHQRNLLVACIQSKFNRHSILVFLCSAFACCSFPTLAGGLSNLTSLRPLVMFSWFRVLLLSYYFVSDFISNEHSSLWWVSLYTLHYSVNRMPEVLHRLVANHTEHWTGLAMFRTLSHNGLWFSNMSLISDKHQINQTGRFAWVFDESSTSRGILAFACDILSREKKKCCAPSDNFQEHKKSPFK